MLHKFKYSQINLESTIEKKKLPNYPLIKILNYYNLPSLKEFRLGIQMHHKGETTEEGTINANT